MLASEIKSTELPELKITEHNKTFFLDYLAEKQIGEKGECWKNICSGTYDYCLKEKTRITDKWLEPQKPFKFEYMMLARLQSDCDYYLGYGNRNPKHLWGITEASHIAEMKRLYELLPVKPEWLFMAEIEKYAREMIREEKEESTDEILT